MRKARIPSSVSPMIFCDQIITVGDVIAPSALGREATQMRASSTSSRPALVNQQHDAVCVLGNATDKSAIASGR